MALTIVSINVNGLRGLSKRAGFLHWLHSLPGIPDIICLQEAHCMSSEECSSWFSSPGLSFAVSPGSINPCGCIVLYRPVLSLVSSSSDSSGRFLLCHFSFRDVPFKVACVYAPNYNPERDNFFSDVASRVDPSVPTVLVGDFNTVFDRAIDRMGSVVGDVSRKSSVALGRLFSDVCCTDIWRYLHPSSSDFTWTKADGSLSSRIDLIGFPYIWFLLFLLVIPCPALFPIIVPLCFLCPSLVLFLLGLVYGNLMSRPWKKKSTLILFVTFGLLGDVVNISFLPWLSGGRWVRVGSRVLRSLTVLVGLGLLLRSAIF